MMSTTSTQDPDLAQMAEMIRQYLSKRPQAADTLEGVVSWWLLRQRYETATALVREALHKLVEQGVLTAVTRPGTGTIYKLTVS